jgi:hypothetical protein
MPLGEFQEGLHLREGLPLIGNACGCEAAGWQIPRERNTL